MADVSAPGLSGPTINLPGKSLQSCLIQSRHINLCISVRSAVADFLRRKRGYRRRNLRNYMIGELRPDVVPAHEKRVHFAYTPNIGGECDEMPYFGVVNDSHDDPPGTRNNINNRQQPPPPLAGATILEPFPWVIRDTPAMEIIFLG